VIYLSTGKISFWNLLIRIKGLTSPKDLLLRSSGLKKIKNKDITDEENINLIK